ncbi:MAG: GGDEF domain-containing protein [Phycisphaerales bacterium]
MASALPPPSTLADAVEGGADAVLAAFLSLGEELADDLRFVADDADDAGAAAGKGAAPPSPVHRARVAHGARTFGRLESANLAPEALASWAASLGAWLHLAEAHRRLHELAYTDELTGAGNRRAFDRFVAEAIELARVRSRPLALMAWDVDNFKRYNDRFGHAAGDEVLRETVTLLKAVVRRGDRVFRIGGDEFVVVFSDPSSPREEGSGPVESVDQLASRFQERIRAMRLPQLGQEGLGVVSVSAGLAAFPRDGVDAPTLLAAADLRALESKRRGKGMITFGPPT